MIVFHSKCYVFLSWGLCATWGHPRRPPGPLGGPDMILGHCGLVRHCLWSSSGALATPGGRRRRLLDLKARMDAWWRRPTLPWVAEKNPNHGFSGISENPHFRRKIKVPKSVQNVLNAIQGMHTHRETTPRHPVDVILPSHASVDVGRRTEYMTVP